MKQRVSDLLSQTIIKWQWDKWRDAQDNTEINRWKKESNHSITQWERMYQKHCWSKQKRKNTARSIGQYSIGWNKYNHTYSTPSINEENIEYKEIEIEYNTPSIGLVKNSEEYLKKSWKKEDFWNFTFLFYKFLDIIISWIIILHHQEDMKIWNITETCKAPSIGSWKNYQLICKQLSLAVQNQ